MALNHSQKTLLLQEFEVTGYKNLTQRVTFGPLGRINVIHGENNVGKSNLLQAMDLFFRLLEIVWDKEFPRNPKLIPASNFERLGHPVNEIFNLVEPTPLQVTGTFSFSEDKFGPWLPNQVQSSEELGIRASLQGDDVQVQIVHLSPGLSDQEVLLFVLNFLPRVQLWQARKTYNRFVLLGVNRRLMVEDTTPPGLHIVPQQLRDALFDAKESREATMVRRWELFVEAMKQFEPILGPGRFDTAFDRQSNQADLVFDSGDMRIAVNLLGSGVQQSVALLGQLLMTPATLVGIEEPELNLRYTLQKQLLKAFQEITASEHGPEQLFLTSHSPAFEAEEQFFAMDMVNGAPTLSQRSRSQARVYTGTRDEEDLYPEMHAQRSEPVCYVSGEGLVLLPEDVRRRLKVEQGGGVSFIPNKQTGRFEIWSTAQVEEWLTGDDSDAGDAG